MGEYKPLSGSGFDMVENEFDYIRWIRRQTPMSSGVLVGPGDDCAVLAPRSRATLVTTDMLMEGVDFVLAEVDPVAIGRKAIGVNLSDIAAMAGVPTAVVVSVSLPKHPPGRTTRDLAEQLYRGMREVADGFGVPIVGGDTNTWDNGLVISVTALGEVTERGAVLRSGAKPGDVIFMTGRVGGSILGRHLAPTPRVREALALHHVVTLHAMIDISDGLAADLNHILTESRCGAILNASSVPIHDDAVALSQRTGQTPLHHALNDGEDFELIFTVSAADAVMLGVQSPVLVYRIGECVTEQRLWLDVGGNRTLLTPAGWIHEMT